MFTTLKLIERYQLPILQYIQTWRTPGLDEWHIFLNYFDTVYFYLFFIPFIMIFVRRSWGLYFGYITAFSALVNAVLKNIFQIPRPFTLDSNLNLLPMDGFSFPSGGAQSAFVIGFLIIWTKPRSIGAWILGINFFFWVSFARLYLGVHYPLDVLAGWITGAFVIYISLLVVPRVFLKTNRKIKKQTS